MVANIGLHLMVLHYCNDDYNAIAVFLVDAIVHCFIDTTYRMQRYIECNVFGNIHLSCILFQSALSVVTAMHHI